MEEKEKKPEVTVGEVASICAFIVILQALGVWFVVKMLETLF